MKIFWHTETRRAVSDWSIFHLWMSLVSLQRTLCWLEFSLDFGIWYQESGIGFLWTGMQIRQNIGCCIWKLSSFYWSTFMLSRFGVHNENDNNFTETSLLACSVYQWFQLPWQQNETDIFASPWIRRTGFAVCHVTFSSTFLLHWLYYGFNSRDVKSDYYTFLFVFQISPISSSYSFTALGCITFEFNFRKLLGKMTSIHLPIWLIVV
jgi:hypothetical protein